MKSLEEQIANLKNAITAQEGLRATLGDAAVDATLAVLREKLVALETQLQPAEQIRKMVTVLFADVSGSTAMAETMDPEEVADLMNALWQRLDAAIVQHGGRIDKHMGDAVMALWSVESASEDDPERAIRAALAMQKETADLRPRSDIQMRIGINTGPVLLGGVGTTGEFTAMGDTVNLASRLEHAAPPGAVLISNDTYRLVRGIFDVQPQEPITVKGKSEPVRTYIVRRAKLRAFRMGTRGVEGVETRMIGRDAELLILQNAFREATEDAETHVVTVVGDAGVGKSRLLYEFEHWLELLPDQPWCFKGRAASAMINIPYGIIRDMFALRFEIYETDSAATVRRHFRAGMAGVLDADQADLVGHLVGFDFREAGSQAVQNLLGSPFFGQQAKAGLTHYVRTVTNEPTVIFLEDIHWADNSSLDLIDHLVAEASRAQLLIVCLARPTLFERRPHWGKGREAYRRLDLRPLSKRESRALVAEILQRADSVPDDLRDLVVDGAEGNPYYVEELIKMLVDDGVIVRGEERWHIEVDRLKRVRVPPTLAEVLQARLDSLPREERELLQCASVVGRQFWDAVVADLAADRVDREQVAPLLDSIRGRELIFRRERSAFEGAGEYIFKHAVLRDVTYETVLLKLRRIYHGQVARWLEANAGQRVGEYLSLIAGHYEQAGELEKAASYLRRSGEELHKISAFRDAIGAFERALAMLPKKDTADGAVLLVELGNAYVEVSNYAKAVQCLEEGRTLARAVNDRQTEVAALNGLGRATMDQEAPGEPAHRFLELGLALARESNDRPGMALALRHLGSLTYHEGRYEQAEAYQAESLALSRELGDRRTMAGALNGLGLTAIRLGKDEQAEQYYEQALAIFRELGDRRGVFACLNNLGDVARLRGKSEAARRYYEASVAIGKEIGYRLGAAISLMNLGYLCAVLNETENTWRYLREALREALAIGAHPLTPAVIIGVALLRTRTGQYESAAELLGLVHETLIGESEQEATPVLAALREKLPADQLEAAMERGKSLKLEAVVKEILAESQTNRKSS